MIFKAPVIKLSLTLTFLTVNLLFVAKLVGGLTDSFVAIVVFIAIGSFLCYFSVLKLTLWELDTSTVIPERVQNAFDVLQEGILIIDKNEQIVMANKSIASLVGTSSEEMVGLKGSELGWLDCQNDEQIKQLPWVKVLLEGQEQKGASLVLLNGLGEKIKLVVNATMITDNAGKCSGSMVTFVDISQLEEKNFELSKLLEKVQLSHEEVQEKSKELEFLANHDPLTLCLNRRALNRKYKALFKIAKADGKELSCLMADIDFFKKVNDTYGHATGDQVIRAVADTLKTCTRESDLVGRYGGEEFCVIFPGQHIETASRIAERIRQAIENETCDGINITVSIGVSSIKDNANSAHELLEQADKALYAAKKSGRNRVFCWEKTDVGKISINTTIVKNQAKDSMLEDLNVNSTDPATRLCRVQKYEGLLEKNAIKLEHREMYDSNVTTRQVRRA